MAELAHLEKRQQYCQDWLETDRPWERWEVLCLTKKCWKALDSHPNWLEMLDYRRKPRTFMVGDVEVRPVQEKPKMGQDCYTAEASIDAYFFTSFWRDTVDDNIRLERGLIHLNKEDAIAHGKALAALTGGE